MITYSAPAKVILSGEHGVVYGKPALATAIGLRIFATLWHPTEHVDEYKLQNSLHKHIVQHVPLQTLTDTVPSDAVKKVISLVQTFLKKNAIPVQREDDFQFALHSQIPLGRGLGSSAALAVAVAACLLEWYTGGEYDKQVINTLAYKVEKHFHKNPSGIDNSVSCYGGLVYYRKEFEFLKQFSSLNSKVSKDIEDRLFLIDSGQPAESTGEMVQAVGKKYNTSPLKMEKAFAHMEKVTKRLVVAIAQENARMFQEALHENQPLLEQIGVVSPSTRKLLTALEPYGVGKVTGAGGKKKGSGFMLFYTTKPDELKTYLYTHKIPYFKYMQDLRGVIRIS